MYKALIVTLLIVSLAECGVRPTEAQPTRTPEQQTVVAAESQAKEARRTEPTPTPTIPTATPMPEEAESEYAGASETTATPGIPEETPEATETAPQVDQAAASESAPAAYGAIHAAGTGKWWYIDSCDTAYWAVQEDINSMRAEVGLSALAMDDSLSQIASTRWEGFVAGGSFDTSGNVPAGRFWPRAPSVPPARCAAAGRTAPTTMTTWSIRNTQVWGWPAGSVT